MSKPGVLSTANQPSLTTQAPLKTGATWGLILLTAIMTLNLIDRQILGVLSQPIKHDLHLTDTQLGLLTGTVFSIFYSVIGLPVANLADRTNRARLMAAACLAWSVMTGVSSASLNFLQLAITRTGVAIGEAGCVPTSFSLLADYFPPSQRATRLSIFWLSAPLSMIGAIVFGGQIAGRFGWRATLLSFAVIGALLAVLAWITLPEPRRVDGVLPSGQAGGRIIALLRNPTFVLLLGASGISTISTYTIGTWMPAFFQRTHGWTLGEMGLRLGIGMAIGSALGALLSAVVSDRFAARRASGHLFVPMLLACVNAPLLTAALWVPDANLAIVFVALWQVVSSGTGPGMMAAFQTISPNRSRAMAFALVSLVGNLLGLGIGPVLAGAISDALLPAYGAQSLRYALMICPIASLTGLVLMVSAARRLAREPIAHP